MAIVELNEFYDLEVRQSDPSGALLVIKQMQVVGPTAVVMFEAYDAPKVIDAIKQAASDAGYPVEGGA